MPSRTPDWLAPSSPRVASSITRKSMTTTKQTDQERERPDTHAETLIEGMWGVRYQVRDVARSVEFYTKVLGFTLDLQNLPAFGQVSVGELKLILSGPGASG